MAGEPRKVTLRAVDENYTGPDPSLKNAANSIKEGRRREREESAVAWAKREGEHAGQLQGQATAHEAELTRIGKIISRAAHRDGMLWGVLLGGGLIAAVIGFTWFIVTQVVIMNTATQRVNYPNPPVLQEPESTTSYPRINPREPGDAQ